MKTKNNLKKNFLILLMLTVAIGTFIALNSKAAKDRGLDIFFYVFIKIAVVALWLYLMKRNWNVWKPGYKIGLALLIAMTTSTTTSRIIDDWPRLPWIKADAFNTVDEFMTNLKEKDYTAATTRFTPRMQRCVNPSDLSQADAQPTSWELNEMDEFSNILGTATFSDGQELSLTVRMVWTDDHWQINSFWFGRWPETRLDYFDMHCGE